MYNVASGGNLTFHNQQNSTSTDFYNSDNKDMSLKKQSVVTYVYVSGTLLNGVTNGSWLMLPYTNLP